MNGHGTQLATGARLFLRRVLRAVATPQARLDAALAFLAREQRSNGEFPTYKARDAALVEERAFDATPFATTYVLHSLSYVDDPAVRALTEPALDFLAGEMEPHGVWRYWTSPHPQHDIIPPDLDDTCCAAAVLRRFGRSLPDHDELLLPIATGGASSTRGWSLDRRSRGRVPGGAWRCARRR